MTRKTKTLWTILPLAGIAFAGVFILSSKDNRRNKQIEAEIEAKRTEVNRIRQTNLKLREKIAYLETQEFEEKEAKSRLNLQKPDEKVVIIRPSVLGDSAEKSVENIVEDKTESITQPNYLKWWNYFFEYREE